MLLLNSDLGVFILSHVLHSLPETLRPRDVPNEQLYSAFTVLRTRIKDSFVEKVGYVFDFAKPSKHGLSFPFTHLHQKARVKKSKKVLELTLIISLVTLPGS